MITSDIDGKKIIIGYVYKLGGTRVSWVFKLKKIIALFITEA